VINKINDPNLREGGINNFIDAANKLQGKPAGSHRGYVFSNAWIYNTIESICIALMVDPKGDAEVIEAQAFMKDTLEDWIPKVLAAQEPDGYLQTAFTLSNREHWSPRYRSEKAGGLLGISHRTCAQAGMVRWSPGHGNGACTLRSVCE
jgi:hypothetical protein